MVHPQGWEGEGRARASKNRVIILLPPALAPSRFCGPRQLRCECASGRVGRPRGRARRGSAARVPWAEAAAAAAGQSGRVPRGDPVAARCQCWALGREVVRVPGKCELPVFTWERRLRGRERVWGAGGSGCGPPGLADRPAPGHDPRRGVSFSSSNFGTWFRLLRKQFWLRGRAEAGAPARRGVPGAMGMPRPRPASSPPPGLFICSARGRTEKARTPLVPGPFSAAPRAPSPGPEFLLWTPSSATAPARPSPAGSHGALALAVGRCLAARSCPSAAAAAARRPASGPPAVGGAGAVGRARLAVPAPAAPAGCARRAGRCRLDRIVLPGAPATPARGHSRGAHHR